MRHVRTRRRRRRARPDAGPPAAGGGVGRRRHDMPRVCPRRAPSPPCRRPTTL